MRNIRKEVADLTRCCDVLLNGEATNIPLTDEERKLVEGYLVRLCERLDVRLTRKPEPRRADDTTSQTMSA